jgi:hypothetical protein
VAISEDKQKELRELASKLGRQYPCFSDPTSIDNSVGLGDVIARITSAVGIKPCKGCKKRQSWLNRFKIG